MKNTIKKTFYFLESLIEKLMAMEVGASAMAASFLAIISLRVLEEVFLASVGGTAEGVIIVFSYNFFFFALLYLLIWVFLSFFLKIELKKLSGVILWAFWLVLLPPILDMMKTGGSVFWSFYSLNGLTDLWMQFITVFGHLPSGIVYYGTKIVFIITIMLAGGFIFVKTKSFLKTLIGSVAVYMIVFIMGTFPSWVAMIYYFFEGSKKIAEIGSIDIFQFFSFPYKILGANGYNIKYAFTTNLNMVYFLALLSVLGAMFWFSNRKGAIAAMKNFRPAQLVYHAGLFLAGMGLGLLAYPQNIQLNLFASLAVIIVMASIMFAWKASVIVNDLYDVNIDRLTNCDRPLQKNVFTQKEYVSLGIVFFGLSLLGGLVISIKFSLLLFIYQIIAWFYSAPPYRLKRFPIIATLFSSLASILVLIIGFSLFSGEDNMKFFPWKIFGLLLIGLTLSLPIKDFKDIEGDRKDGVWTIPVIFGEGVGRLIVASGIFSSFMLSVFVLNEMNLFWPALFSGGATFWAMTNKKIKPRQLNWWVLGILTVYTLILVKTLFF